MFSLIPSSSVFLSYFKFIKSRYFCGRYVLMKNTTSCVWKWKNSTMRCVPNRTRKYKLGVILEMCSTPITTVIIIILDIWNFCHYGGTLIHQTGGVVLIRIETHFKVSWHYNVLLKVSRELVLELIHSELRIVFRCNFRLVNNTDTVQIL